MTPATIPENVNKELSSLTSANLLCTIPGPGPASLPVQPIEFTPALAHEIRNPLSSIKMAAQMLRSISKDNMLMVYFDIILRNSERINDIVAELLTPVPVEEVKPEVHCLHDILDEALDVTAGRIILKNVTVVKLYGAQDCMIELNKPRIKIALTNIIINAIEAMKMEGGELRLITRSFGNKCILQIEDNGCGIKAEDLKNIFNPYFTNKPDGLGLGLATTYSALQSDQVVMHVKSQPGAGTCFALLFKNNLATIISKTKRGIIAHIPAAIA